MSNFTESLPNGFFGIGIDNSKKIENIGTLWRSAYILGASFIFVIGHRYKKQGADTIKTWSKIPLYQYDRFADFKKSIPYACKVIGVEIDEKSQAIQDFTHPDSCIYLLGSEDHGLSNEAYAVCHELVQLPGDICLNVAVSGSIVMYDRIQKNPNKD